MMTYEEYKLGEMHFPPINGTDEGNFFIFLLGIICGLFGQDFLNYSIIDKFSITIGKLIQLGVIVGGLSCIYNLYLHTYKKKGFKEMSKIFLDNVPFYSVVAIPIYYIIFILDFYTEYKWLILWNSCLLFARITIDIQIKILTLDNLGCNYMVLISNIIYIITISMHSTLIKYYVLLSLFALQSAELGTFIYVRSKEITTYLNIRIFCINTVPKLLNSNV